MPETNDNKKCVVRKTSDGKKYTHTHTRTNKFIPPNNYNNSNNYHNKNNKQFPSKIPKTNSAFVFVGF